MSRPKGLKTDVEPLELWEYELIIAKLDTHWRLFYDLLWATGIRVGEGLAIKKTDLQDGGVWVTRLKRKDKLRDFIPLPHDLYERLLPNSFRSHSKRLFPYTEVAAWLALKQACKRAGVRETIHPHLFRHGFGRRAVQANLGGKSALEQLTFVQRMMGHASIRNTMVYTKATKADAEQAFRRLNMPENMSEKQKLPTGSITEKTSIPQTADPWDRLGKFLRDYLHKD